MNRTWPLALLLAVSGGLAACGSEAPQRLPVPTVDALTFSPASVLVPVGETFELEVTAVYSDGAEKVVTPDVEWVVVDPSVVRVITSGRFEATATGATTLEAAFEDVAGSLEVTVTASPLVSLRVQPGSATVEVGQTFAFRAQGTFEDGSQSDLTDEVEWISGDEAVATVLAGVATASTAGRVDIVARSGDVQDDARLTVNPPRLTEVRIVSQTREVPLGLTLQLGAEGTFSNGAVRDVTDEVTWRSNNEAVLTVSDEAGRKGLVTTVSAGQTTVFADGPGRVSGTVSVRVLEPDILQLAIRPSTATIAAGDERFFSAIAVLTDGSERVVTRDVRWRSSAPAVAHVFDTQLERGQVEARSAGQATLTVLDPETGISSQATGGNAYITVLPPSLLSISVTPRDVQVAAGLTAQLTATGFYSDGSSRNLSNAVTWSSSDPTVAAVDPSGLTSALAEGTVTVSVRDPMSGVSSSGQGNASVQVLPPILQSFDIAPTTASLIEGDTQAFTATGQFSDGVTRDVSTLVRWSTNSSAVRFAGNVATALSAGTATVTASAPGAGPPSSNSAVVTVIPLRLVDLRVTPQTANLIIAGEAQLTATGTYNNTQVIDLTDAVTWSSSNPSAATVETGPPSAGLVTAAGGGSTTIAVSDPVTGASSGDFGGSAQVTVSSTVSLVSIAVSAPTNQITIGQPEPMTALGTFSNGAVLQMTNTVQWSTSDPAVASISNQAGSRGVLTGVGTGTVSPMAVHVPTGVRSANDPVIEVLLPPVFNGSWNGPTQSVDGTGSSFVPVGSVTFGAGQVGATTVVADVDVRINFLKTDGSCAAPASSFAYHNEIGFQLRGPAGQVVNLALANAGPWTGNTAMPGPVDVTFDDEAAGPPPSGTPVAGTYRPRTPLSAFDNTDPRGVWRLEAQDSAGGDPLCVNNYTIILTVR